MQEDGEIYGSPTKDLWRRIGAEGSSARDRGRKSGNERTGAENRGRKIANGRPNKDWRVEDHGRMIFSRAERTLNERLTRKADA